MKLKNKRGLSYIIDLSILFLSSWIIGLLFPINNSEILLGNLNQNFIQKEITFGEFKESYINLIHQIDKDNFIFNIVSIILIIGLFILLPKILEGQTIGQKIMKIKTKNSLKIFLIRAIILYGLGYMILAPTFVYFTSSQVYFIFINFLAFCQILLVITNVFMVLYKKDHLGIVDILTKVRIEEIK